MRANAPPPGENARKGTARSDLASRMRARTAGTIPNPVRADTDVHGLRGNSLTRMTSGVPKRTAAVPRGGHECVGGE
eukprot:6826877-Alexandrium_andersonii.AAC.1